MSQSVDKFLIISVPKTRLNAKSKHYVVVTQKEESGTAFFIDGSVFNAEVRAITTSYEEAEKIVDNLLQ